MLPGTPRPFNKLDNAPYTYIKVVTITIRNILKAINKKLSKLSPIENYFNYKAPKSHGQQWLQFCSEI